MIASLHIGSKPSTEKSTSSLWVLNAEAPGESVEGIPVGAAEFFEGATAQFGSGGPGAQRDTPAGGDECRMG
jgi:hypothetical protein